MQEIIDKETSIEDKIYELNGIQVMLDSDLAGLYNCKNGTKDVNKAVKRNINRFPKDFYFQLNDNEKRILWFQSGTANTTFICNDSFHDRFIIIDRSTLYTLGSSLKDIGKKCFGIHEISNKEYLLKILEEIKII